MIQNTKDGLLICYWEYILKYIMILWSVFYVPRLNNCLSYMGMFSLKRAKNVEQDTKEVFMLWMTTPAYILKVSFMCGRKFVDTIFTNVYWANLFKLWNKVNLLEFHVVSKYEG